MIQPISRVRMDEDGVDQIDQAILESMEIDHEAVEVSQPDLCRSGFGAQ